MGGAAHFAKCAELPCGESRFVSINFPKGPQAKVCFEIALFRGARWMGRRTLQSTPSCPAVGAGLFQSMFQGPPSENLLLERPDSRAGMGRAAYFAKCAELPLQRVAFASINFPRGPQLLAFVRQPY